MPYPRVRSGLLALALILGLAGAGVARGEEMGLYKVDTAAREVLLAMGASVHHGRAGGTYQVELTPAQAESLRRRGFAVEQLFPNLAEQDRSLRRQPAFDQFHTYDQIRNDFYACATAHPEIARLIVLGHSVQNRELFALRITDNPDQEENEPELAFWGGIHGNEYGGGELPYLQGLYLCDNYGIDPSVTSYVDDNVIWCIPMINPDGRALGTRVNANGVDLNRDLGYEWSGEGGSPAPFSQVETRAVREFCVAHPVMLSTTFHCSGDIVFYPWGYAPQNVPDFGITVDLARLYATAASYAYGNSWQDYETHGEVLDYVYGSHGAACMTVEVSNSSALIAQTFARNPAGMNLYCGLAASGLHGTVRDGGTGDPVEAAVWIAGNPIPAYSDPQVGDLHRAVRAGTYVLTAWAPGYLPRTIAEVVIPPDSPGLFEASLEPGGGEYAFRVVTVDQRDPNHVHANLSFPSSSLGPPDGVACSLGSAGFIVLDLGAGHEIQDRPGADLEVLEAITPQDPVPEAYQVYGGDAYAQAVLIGSGVGTTSFDLNGSGLTSVRYLRIFDASGAPPNGALAGMDLDAVIGNINGPSSSVTESGVSPAAGLSLAAGPNPCRDGTTVRLTLRGPSPVELTVYDALGRRLGSPLRRLYSEAGTQEIRLDTSRWNPGAYFFRVTAGGTSASGRCVRVR